MAEEKPKIVHTVTLEGPRPNIIVSEGSYRGSPMFNMIYMGGGRPFPFGMGIGKVKQILHCLPEMVEFYNKHKHLLKDE